jgi:hypothetical protein
MVQQRVLGIGKSERRVELIDGPRLQHLAKSGLSS